MHTTSPAGAPGEPMVTIADIRAAAERIRPAVAPTPLIPCRWSWRDRPLQIKPESLQATGAFKIRGAYNALAKLSADQKSAGVVTHSSGNHGQAVAFAARLLGISATVVMPDVASPVKIDATRRWGADVVLVPVEQRAPMVEQLVAEHGWSFVPPYDHLDVIAGQGTAGLEIAYAWPEVDVVLVPVGGGGLISGVATAIKTLAPQARVIGVEPELAADAAESLQSGRLVAWSHTDVGRTSADGLRSASLGPLTWAHVRTRVDDIVTVTEEEIRAATRTLATRCRLVAEPSGAVTTAAYLFRGEQLPRGNTVAVLSGGNADPRWLSDVLSEPSDLPATPGIGRRAAPGRQDICR